MSKLSSKVERVNTGKRGARKTKLSRLQLAQMGKGPTAKAISDMRRSAEKSPLAKVPINTPRPRTTNRVKSA